MTYNISKRNTGKYTYIVCSVVHSGCSKCLCILQVFDYDSCFS